MSLARELETVPHAFGDELEWNIRPVACPVLAEHDKEDNDFATLDDVENAAHVTPALLDGYVAFLRGSAVEDIKMPGDKLFNGDFYAADEVRRATGTMAALNLNVSSGPLPGLNLALPMPVEAEDHREMFQFQDGKVLTRPPKTYTREEFCYLAEGVWTIYGEDCETEDFGHHLACAEHAEGDTPLLPVERGEMHEEELQVPAHLFFLWGRPQEERWQREMTG
ncbi:hypothetical protein CYMTET_35798 [Cymbomonas tetramitiformis]|uniref:Uncharacterized protein n=1 Tax=Cymbomonas tetramitiformis TaxID=36881 RepID=A0AAE0F8I3_9CHLO|nr:hypothetical protein CYMTET_35798 [Cymbomonas tetramitiformis]